MSATSPSGPTRVCQGCFQSRPVTDFRRKAREASDRSARCRSCHNEAERLRRSRARRQVTGKEMVEILAKLRDESNNARVVAICDQMTRRFGGVEGFIRVWEACLTRDLEKGGYAAFRHLAAVVRLAQYCEETRPSPESMTDEQLEATIRALGGQVPVG